MEDNNKAPEKQRENDEVNRNPKKQSKDDSDFEVGTGELQNEADESGDEWEDSVGFENQIDKKLTPEQLEIHQKIQEQIDHAMDESFNDNLTYDQMTDGTLEKRRSEPIVSEKSHDQTASYYDYTYEVSEALKHEKLFFGTLAIYRKTGFEARKFAVNARGNIDETKNSLSEQFDKMLSEIVGQSQLSDEEYKKFKRRYHDILLHIKPDKCIDLAKQPDSEQKKMMFDMVFGKFVIRELKLIVDDYEANSNIAEGLLNASFAHDAKVKGILLNEIKRIGDQYVGGFKFDEWASDNIFTMGKTTRDKYMRIARRTDCHEYLILGVDRVDKLCSKTEKKMGEKYVVTEDFSTLLGRYMTTKVNLNNLKESSKEKWEHFLAHIGLVTTCETVAKSICDNKDTRKKSKTNPDLKKKYAAAGKKISSDIHDITLEHIKTNPNFKPPTESDFKEFVGKSKRKLLEGKSVEKKETEKVIKEISARKNDPVETHPFANVEYTLIEFDDYLLGLNEFLSDPKKNDVNKIDIDRPTLTEKLDLIFKNIEQLKKLAEKGVVT